MAEFFFGVSMIPMNYKDEVRQIKTELLYFLGHPRVPLLKFTLLQTVGQDGSADDLAHLEEVWRKSTVLGSPGPKHQRGWAHTYEKEKVIML